MKKMLIFITCTIILVPLIVSAQVKEQRQDLEPATKLEEFLAKKGRLIVKDFYDLGVISARYGSKISFNAVVIYEPGLEDQRIRGLRVEITKGGKYERSDTSFLDLEEIESLSTAISYMMDLSTKWKTAIREYTEVVFSTKGYFRIGFAHKGNNQIAFSSSGYGGNVSCYFSSAQELQSVKVIVDKGLALLNEK